MERAIKHLKETGAGDSTMRRGLTIVFGRNKEIP
jgi:hypothetical protein